ncbi:MAG: PilZ domain-containing protein [Acidimicrobiales bacterium]
MAKRSHRAVLRRTWRVMELRRRAPRVGTSGWVGRFIVEDDPESGWRDCEVTDISLLGLGVELYGDLPGDIIGRRLVVHVQGPMGNSVSLRLAGEVRYLGNGRGGGTRAGLEFVGLSDTERAILKAMEVLKVSW